MRLISLALAASMLHTTFAFDRQALSSWFTGLNPDKVVHAINCGSTEEIVDLLGVTYSAVTPYTSFNSFRTSAIPAVNLARLAPRFSGHSLTAIFITLRDGEVSSISCRYPQMTRSIHWY